MAVLFSNRKIPGTLLLRCRLCAARGRAILRAASFALALLPFSSCEPGAGGSSRSGVSARRIGGGARSVEINWEVPSRRVRGGALDDLAGFFLYLQRRGPEAEAVERIDVGNVNLCRLEGFLPGEEIRVAVSAYDSRGAEGPRSAPVEIEID